ncbi:DHA2 family multidrug resistance protein [Angulomicrobium tetraedrale]|uniref:DHA2 family multidrug resistance protein n=1 Tax=Ancylobacter tetraedralis TaxID=217068 RepID=A0A839ZAH1_9HYPH|nr:DHA2 family multidrug resistance protein [Ancylobacter tetraedralis]
MSMAGADAAAGSAQVPPSRSPRPLCAVAAVLLGSFLVGFDTRLFAIGLPDLRGAYGLSFDQGAWLNTFATAPQILIAPAVAWLAATFGVRRVLFWPSLAYAVISLLLPLVRGWETLVVLHSLRGLLLGVFIPATIMIVLRTLPPRWWVAALAIYAFRLSFSLNSGPLLIGLYDVRFGWEWIYWQDMLIAPVMGVLAVLGTPREKVDFGLLERADWGGMALLGTGWALIYAGVDQGNRLDWFQSGLITSLIGGGAALIVAFLINESVVRHPWASYKVIASRNVGLSCLIVLCYTGTSLSNSQLVPGFLTNVAGLRPEEIGWPIFVTACLPLLVAAPIAVFFVRYCDARLSMLVGFIAFAVSARMGTELTLVWSPWSFASMGVIQSIGQGFTLLAVIVFILANSDPRNATASAAYIQVVRLGGAETATSVMATFLRHREQLHSYLLGLHVPAGGDHTEKALAQLGSAFSADGASPNALAARSTMSLHQLVSQQANVLAYIDGFQLTYWIALIGLILVALLKAAPAGPLVPASAAARRVGISR